MRKFALLCLLAVNMALVAGDAGYTFPKSTAVATSITTFSNADKAVVITDQRVLQTGTMSAPRTVTLPAAAGGKAGVEITVGDASGTVSATNYLSVVPTGADTINGATSDTLRSPYGTRTYTCNGTNGWTFNAAAGESASSASYFKNLNRPLRGILLGDSLWNLATRDMLTATMPAGSQWVIANQGGEFMPYSAAQFSKFATVWARVGNQLPDSRFDQWTLTNLTVQTQYVPTYGCVMLKLQDTGAASGTAACSFNPPDEGIIEGLTFSIKMGLAILDTAIQPTIVVKNGETVKASKTLDINGSAGSMPARYLVGIPPGSYAHGETLTITITPTASKTYANIENLYASEPMLNVGIYPTPYTETSGTPQAVGAYATIAAPEGINRQMFDVAVLVHSNDGSFFREAAENERAITATINSALNYASRVILLNPPPKSGGGAWLTGASDTRDSPNDWYGSLYRVALKQNVLFVDVRAKFMSLTAAGTYTVGDLKGDAIHPSTLGTQVMLDEVANKLNGPDQIPSRTGDGVHVQYGGALTGTGWSQHYAALSTPGILALPIGFGYYGCAQKSSTAGDTVTYGVIGEQVALVWMSDDADAHITVTVDGGPVGAYTLQNGFGNFVTLTMRMTDGYGPRNFGHGQHTITVTVVDGPVNMIGCIGL
jgi:hypothetical protein